MNETNDPESVYHDMPVTAVWVCQGCGEDVVVPLKITNPDPNNILDYRIVLPQEYTCCKCGRVNNVA